MTDRYLLQIFVSNEQKRDGAFTHLVKRHVHWMYASALRQTGDPHVAEDVVQAAFIVLARKAPSRVEKQNLTAWLAGVVRLAAKRRMRDLARQRHHEAKVTMTTPTKEAPSAADQAAWNEIAPYLDEAVGQLREADREAILLRFYRQQSFVEVGASLGISEEAARKRVDRALEKLRPMLTRQGGLAGVGGGAIAGVLFSQTTASAAPAGLIATATTIGLSTAGGAVALSGASAVTAKGIVTLMTYTQLKIIAGGILAALLLGGLGVTVVRNIHAPQSPVAAGAQNVSAPTGGRIIAQLKNGLSMELLGISESPSDGKPWYRPDGSTMPAPYPRLGVTPTPKPGHVTREYAFATHFPDDNPGAPATFRLGHPDALAPNDPQPTPAVIRVPYAWGYENVGGSMKDCLGVATLDLPNRPARFRFQVAASAWQTVLSSRADADVSLPLPDGSIQAWLSRPREVYGDASVEYTYSTLAVRNLPDERLVAIDKQGKTHPTEQRDEGGSFENMRWGFLNAPGLPLAQLDHFELQRRPFDAWIEFDNVSSDLAQPSDVKISASDGAQAFVGTLKNGVSIELLGIAETPSAGKQWMSPDGSPLATPPYTRSDYGPLKASDFTPAGKWHEFAFSMNLKADITDAAEVMGYSLLDAPDWAHQKGMLGLGGQPTSRPTPSPYQRFEGQVIPDNDDAKQSFRFTVAAGPWQTFIASRKDQSAWLDTPGYVPAGFGMPYTLAPDGPVYTTFTDYMAPAITRVGNVGYHNHARRIVAIDVDGGVHPAGQRSHANSASADGMWVTWEVFSNGVTAARFARFEVQTRPFDQWIEFDNIPIKPGQTTPVRVVTSDETSTNSR